MVAGSQNLLDAMEKGMGGGEPAQEAQKCAPCEPDSTAASTAVLMCPSLEGFYSNGFLMNAFI